MIIHNKKRNRKLCMNIDIVSCTHDANMCRSVKTCVIVVGGLECVKYEPLKQTTR